MVPESVVVQLVVLLLVLTLALLTLVVVVVISSNRICAAVLYCAAASIAGTSLVSLPVSRKAPLPLSPAAGQPAFGYPYFT